MVWFVDIFITKMAQRHNCHGSNSGDVKHQKPIETVLRGPHGMAGTCRQARRNVLWAPVRPQSRSLQSGLRGHGNQWNDVHSRGSWAIRGHTMPYQHPHPLKWLNHVVSASSFCLLPSWFTQRLYSYSGNQSVQYKIKHLILSYIR